MGFDYDLFVKYAPRMLTGLLVTAELVGLSLIIGGLLAFPIALARARGG